MEELLQYVPLFWSIISCITCIITIKSKDIDALWFSISSFVTLIVSFIFKELSIVYQLVIFVSLTLIPILTVSKLIKRKSKIASLKKSSDKLIGKTVLITEDCNEFNKGCAMLNKKVWSIECQPGYSLKKGDEGIIVAINKKDLIVKQAD